MCLDTIFTADLLKAFPQFLGVRITMCPTLVFSLGSFLLYFCWAVSAVYWVAFLVTVVVAVILSVAVNIFILDPMYGPPRVFALAQSLP